MNKETAADVLSLLMQTAFSGRAEIGLVGDDNLSFKVSADGSTWNVGLVVDKTTGGIRFLASELDVASAATADIGAAAALKVRITGTTTITSLGSAANAIKIVRFAGALTLTHNATSLVLPGGANIPTAAGDTMLAASDSSGNWRVYAYQKASGKAVIGPASTDITDSTATGRSALTAASAAALATAAGVGTGNSPTFTALTLSNGQIAFPAAQVPSANANTLDDYEEGTWTPTVSFGTPGTSSFTYTTQDGTYTKIGDTVYVRFDLVFTPTIGTGTGSVLINGIPFSPETTVGGCGIVTNLNSNWAWPAGRTQAVLGFGSSSTFAMSGLGTGVSISAFSTTALTPGSSHTVRGGIVYKT